MAKQKRLYSFREWQQLIKARKEAAAEKRQLAKQAKLEAWWAIPAERNYVQVSVSRRMDTPGEVYLTGSVLPDKRRLGANDIGIHPTVTGTVDRNEVIAHLVTLAQTLLASNAMWDLACGPPLERPVNFEGHPPQAIPRQRWQDQASTPATATPTPTPAGYDDVAGLAAMRQGCEMWLDREREDATSPFRDWTLEEYCEVLVMLSCGQDIILLTDRDPWRWEHTAEQLRTVEAHEYGISHLELLRHVVEDLSRHRSPESVIELLLTVFVEGR
jgi:hypothetical protein